ncbi:MAG: diguanylate cyclase, partial [Actinomycetota bacterium]
KTLPEVLDAASDAYLSTDGSGRVLAANRAAESLFGYRCEEMLGADAIRLLAPGELQTRQRALHEHIVAAGATTEPVQVTLVRSDGVEVQVEFSAWVTGFDGEVSVHALYRDVSERARVHEELTEQVRRLTEAQALAGLGSWEWDLATDTVVGSAQLFDIFGLGHPTPAIVDTFIALLHPEDRPQVQAEIDAAARDGRPLDYEARFVRPDGKVVWVAAHGDATLDADGVPVRLSGTVHDITERKLAELELVRLTITDALTGLGNRTLLDQRLEEVLNTGEASCAPLSLLLLDLDRFKAVNDTHGHAAGDAVLVELARRFNRSVRDGDTLARLGGDEFALVLPGTDQRDATRIAERLVEAASTPIEIDAATTVTVGASVGIAVTRDARHGIGEFRRQADRAMYAAKHGGRSRHVMFTADLEMLGASSLTVCPDEAGAWGDYFVELRDEIAQRKSEGALPENFRAPTSVRRTLETLVAAIEQLPREQREAELALPERVELEEFVSHQSMVHDWADAQ